MYPPLPQVLKLKTSSSDQTGSQLLKALGAKTVLAGRGAPQLRVLCLTVTTLIDEASHHPSHVIPPHM